MDRHRRELEVATVLQAEPPPSQIARSCLGRPNRHFILQKYLSFTNPKKNRHNRRQLQNPPVHFINGASSKSHHSHHFTTNLYTNLIHVSSRSYQNKVISIQIMSSRSDSWTDDSSGSLFPQYDSLIEPISDEQFISCHSIDRELYSELIFTHGRDAIESMQVMAFWLWLERDGYCSRKLVFRILNELPPHLVYQVADETVVCLKCIENDHFIYSVSGDDDEISFLQSLMERKSLSLVLLHENRSNIHSKVTTITNEICFRAFKDILHNSLGGNSGTGVVNRDEASSSIGNRYGASTNIIPPPISGAYSGSVVVNTDQGSSSTSIRYDERTTLMPPPVMGIPVYPRPQVGFMGAPAQYLANEGIGGHELMTNAIGIPINPMVVVASQGLNSHLNPYEHLHHPQQGEQEVEIMNSHLINAYDLHHPQQGVHQNEVGNSHFSPYDLRREQYERQQTEVVNRELGERMSHVQISEHHAEVEENKQVPPDDRTIFLTFSKGYPISENEIREFFTRRYGDSIEGIYMQEVGPAEQSLYARVVIRDPSTIERVAPRGSKAKFVINGKHVWARKYVKKTTANLPSQGTGAAPSQGTGAAPSQ